MKSLRLAPPFAILLLGASIPIARAGGDAPITALHEGAVTIGMSAGEVLATLGPPAMRARYGAGRGPSWAYPVVGALPGTRAFYVEFGPDNRVTSAQEYSIPVGA